MKVLIVTSSMDDGGVARIVSDLTLNLPDDWKFDILLTHADDIRYEYKGKVISLGVKEPKSRTNLLYAFKVFVKRICILNKLKKNENYDACISFMDSGNVANILSGNKHCKNILSIENHMSMMAKYDWKYRWIVNPMIKMLYNQADGIVVCSEESKADLEENYRIKKSLMSRIYCSVDNDQIRDSARSFVVPQNEKIWFDRDRTIITAGRLSKQKGQWHLIRAFKKVVSAVPDARLVIFGEGELKDYLTRLISEYGLEESAIIHGYSKNLPGYISASAVFAMPSLFEGFPTALLMALSCGIACQASDFVSGAREQLSPGYKGVIDGYHKGEYGIISSNVNEEMPDFSETLSDAENSMADALIVILENKDVRDKYAAMAKERSKAFDSLTICKEWEDVIERVCRDAG